MNPIGIRRMQMLDIEAVMKVEQASFSTPWSQQAFESELKNELTYYLVLCEGRKIIGYAGMWIIVDEAHVTNVAVLPEYRGRGLGEKLMSSLKEAAAARGAASMTLEVRPSNRAARSLYEKLGFVRCGLRRNYYTDTAEDALIMWCRRL
ncbi:hypothetical protein P22_2382 [Propionispora sp. 2/2-37]|uniref:ribosomal protein S18-alanine N-acetyltransferase n=1 Tax=Propionispora sp. 2/2-37 TaxID=1677858 RepID=UPI0006BB590F|nr:ribosomal protein S18-alanine N-acetyltransferase [Propionispora sp. 2/2-37]CUH96292.1 hypothetical protein P22_2382 [Propionispora sp. 2/2-37]